MSKNIVICSDGTGQSYAGTDSNVLRLYTLASKKAPQQITCYDPGIGTLPLPTGRTRLGRWIRHLEELSFGVGLIDNLVELYAYLMRHYTPGDRIYLFGFSRGAFTVRALAGMLHVCGLLRPDDEHLLQYAAGIYQTSEHRIRLHRRSRGLPVHQKTPRGAPIDHAIVVRRVRASVGWVAVAPREVYRRFERSRILQPVDEKPTWSVPCFFIDRTQRGRGLTIALLRAA